MLPRQLLTLMMVPLALGESAGLPLPVQSAIFQTHIGYAATEYTCASARRASTRCRTEPHRPAARPHRTRRLLAARRWPSILALDLRSVDCRHYVERMQWLFIAGQGTHCGASPAGCRRRTAFVRTGRRYETRCRIQTRWSVARPGVRTSSSTWRARTERLTLTLRQGLPLSQLHSGTEVTEATDQHGVTKEHVACLLDLRNLRPRERDGRKSSNVPRPRVRRADRRQCSRASPLRPARPAQATPRGIAAIESTSRTTWRSSSRSSH